MKRIMIILSIIALSPGLSSTIAKHNAASATTTAKHNAASANYQTTFIHPAGLHTEADFARMRFHVNAGNQPWKGSWDILVANPRSQLNWTARPTAVIIRGGTGQNYPQLYNDIAAAYQTALRWKINGDTAYANKSIAILNAWSSTLTAVNGNADRFLAAGIYGYQLAVVGEIMRSYSGWTAGDFQRFKNMMLNIFYPMNEHFLTNHNDACITNYWANWDLCNMASILAIGILCDNSTLFNRAIEYFKTGGGNGSIYHAVPFLHDGDLGQWQESGRDQGHSTLGIGLMAVVCELAWNQGVELYSYADSRFRKGANYVASYNTGNDVPFTAYWWGSGQNCSSNWHTVVSSSGRGNIRPVWEAVINHYYGRLGQSVPYIEAYAALHRPEGGGGNYGTTSGGFDQLGFGSLTFTRGPIPAGSYSIRNRASGKMLDNLGVTADGGLMRQWTDNPSPNQNWSVTYIDGYAKLQCVTGSKYLDSLGHTGNDSTVGQWANSDSYNQQWIIRDIGEGYFKIINRANGQCLDTGGATADGSIMEFWGNGESWNQQWQFVPQ